MQNLPEEGKNEHPNNIRPQYTLPMDSSADGGPGPQSTAMPPPQSHFDPVELIGLPLPFVDPFRQDLSEQALSSMTSLSIPIHPRAVMTARPVCQDPCQVSLMPSPQCVMKGAATPGACPELADVDAELEEAVVGSGSGRVRLTPALAIHIFNQGKNRTKHSAALLSTEFGVSPKAIRDIWTKRSWASETRPHWTLDDELSFDSLGQP
jgi:hypothetical protein